MTEQNKGDEKIRQKRDMVTLSDAASAKIDKWDIIRLIIPRAIVHKANKLELWIRQDLGNKNSRNQNLRDGSSDFGYTNPSYSATAERGLSADNFLGELSNFSQNDLENPGHFCGGPFSTLASSSTVTPEERSSSKVKMAGLPRWDEMFPPPASRTRISLTPLSLYIRPFGKTRISSPKDTSQKAVP